MRYNYDISERAAAIFRAFQKLHGLTDDALSRGLDGLFHPKTLNRQLNADPTFTEPQVEVFAKVIAAALPCDLMALKRYILCGGPPPLRVRELLAAQIFDLTEGGLTELSEKLLLAQRVARVHYEIRPYPSPEMLTDEIRSNFYRTRSRALGQRGAYHADLLSRFAAPMRDRFMFGLGAMPERTYVFMPHDGLRRLLYETLPEADCSESEIDALVESWIDDSLFNRDVHFGIFDSHSVGGDYFATLEAIRIFDRRHAAKRLVGCPGVLWFEQKESDAAPPPMIHRGLEAIEAARRAVPYDIDCKAAVERALKEFLSPRTWYRRSSDARSYRSPSLN